MRSEELLEFLKQRNIEPIVALSENATQIVGRIQYDIKINQIVGFAMPTSESNGVPIPFSYPARNTNEIIDHFSSGNIPSSFVNVIMAKPITTQKTPSFCLLLYGSNNDYTSFNVCKRWEYVVSKLKSLGITVISVSSDSDPRYNSAMRKLSDLGRESNTFSNKSWFSCGDSADSSIKGFPVYIQDSTHIGTKMRNLFLKTIEDPSKLPFGKYHIRQDHLEFLVNHLSKDKHNLTPTTLNPKDKQNFDSVLRMTDRNVINLLLQHVRDSSGTAKYLEIIRKIIDSYMDQSLKPLERVYEIWYAVFMLRIWRNFVVSQKSLTLEKNFMTVNCYSCVELNAHSLITSLIRLKENKMDNFFFPSSLDSQPCESLFRQVRSFTTTYSTVANCSVKEILERISKIQLQNDIEVMDSIFTFSNYRSQKSKSLQVFDLPTKEQIEERIECSRKDAMTDGIHLRLIKKQFALEVDLSCKVNPIDKSFKVVRKSKDELNKTININENVEKFLKLKTILLKKFSNKFAGKNVDDRSQYVEVHLNLRKRIIIKKTSLCWILRNDYQKLSSDRLLRVQSERKVKKEKSNAMKKYKQIRLKKR